MDKKTITKALREESGSIFINVSQIAKAVGVGRNTAAELVDGLDYYANGNAKLFLAEDVAARIMMYRIIC